jgi:hypothetical protein
VTEAASKYAATMNGWLSQQGKVVDEMEIDLDATESMMTSICWTG